MHAYTPAAMQQAIAAGVKCIEHGHLMDEATAKLMAEKGYLVELAADSGRDRLSDVCRRVGQAAARVDLQPA